MSSDEDSNEGLEGAYSVSDLLGELDSDTEENTDIKSMSEKEENLEVRNKYGNKADTKSMEDQTGAKCVSENVQVEKKDENKTESSDENKEIVKAGDKIDENGKESCDAEVTNQMADTGHVTEVNNASPLKDHKKETADNVGSQVLIGNNGAESIASCIGDAGTKDTLDESSKSSAENSNDKHDKRKALTLALNNNSLTRTNALKIRSKTLNPSLERDKGGSVKIQSDISGRIYFEGPQYADSSEYAELVGEGRDEEENPKEDEIIYGNKDVVNLMKEGEVTDHSRVPNMVKVLPDLPFNKPGKLASIIIKGKLG